MSIGEKIKATCLPLHIFFNEFGKWNTQGRYMQRLINVYKQLISFVMWIRWCSFNKYPSTADYQQRTWVMPIPLTGICMSVYCGMWLLILALNTWWHKSLHLSELLTLLIESHNIMWIGVTSPCITYLYVHAHKQTDHMMTAGDKYDIIMRILLEYVKEEHTKFPPRMQIISCAVPVIPTR